MLKALIAVALLAGAPAAMSADRVNPPVRIALSFDMVGLAGDPVTIDPAKGYDFAFRFDPNDLGKADFRATPLKRAGDDLLLERYGRSIRFRRVTTR